MASTLWSSTGTYSAHVSEICGWGGGGAVITVIYEMGKGCQLGVGLHREITDLVETRGQKNNCPITAHPVKKQMKGQASYQLLVVSPEVRKSKELKGKGVGNGGKGGKKKTKLLLANCHMHHMTVFRQTAPQGPGSLADMGAKNFQQWVTTHPNRKKSLGPFPLSW